MKLQELSLLQWIIRYDSIRLIETDNKGAVVIVVVVAIIMLVVILFNLYIKHYDGLNWDKFKWELIKIYLTKREIIETLV